MNALFCSPRQRGALLVTALLSANGLADDAITAERFGCIRDMTPVRGFFVANLQGALEATLAVANAPEGKRYPEGTVIQLVPTEVMVKREAGFSPATNDWEFIELDVSEEGSTIRARGFANVVNRFGGNCFGCHVKAEPQWDLICEQDHGCDPIPLTPVMLKAIQKTDPRCAAVPLSEEEQAALKALSALR
jgi:hypothetical protein